MTERSMILVIGGSGQIGHELVRELSAFGTVTAPKRRELDLTSLDSTRDAVRRMRPTIVVNAAAYTMVDRAESEPELCARINAESPALLAAECQRLGAAFLHFSTDYVFDGTKGSPYVETDATMPLNVYGRTKREGEEAVAAVGGAFIILRTAWIYGSRGRNFPATVLQLAREREELAVVNDQVGAPTSAAAVAAGVAHVLRVLGRERDFRDAVERASGLYHLTASGSTTWYDFARRILADDPRAIEHVCRVVRPISSAEYPRPARRPAYSVLDNTKIATRFGVTLPSWTDQWRAMVEQLRLSSRSTFAPRAESRASL